MIKAALIFSRIPLEIVPEGKAKLRILFKMFISAFILDFMMQKLKTVTSTKKALIFILIHRPRPLEIVPEGHAGAATATQTAVTHHPAKHLALLLLLLLLPLFLVTGRLQRGVGRLVSEEAAPDRRFIGVVKVMSGGHQDGAEQQQQRGLHPAAL